MTNASQYRDLKDKRIKADITKIVELLRVPLKEHYNSLCDDNGDYLVKARILDQISDACNNITGTTEIRPLLPATTTDEFDKRYGLLQKTLKKINSLGAILLFGNLVSDRIYESIRKEAQRRYDSKQEY